MIDLYEAKDLDVFKKILNAFAVFVDSQPGTGMGKIYRQLLDVGLKSVPKNQRAQSILAYVIKTESAPASVQALMNTCLAELPVTLRPVYKSGNSKLTAFWSKGGKIYSKVIDLLDLNNEGSGEWVDEKGNKVELIDVESL